MVATWWYWVSIMRLYQLILDGIGSVWACVPLYVYWKWRSGQVTSNPNRLTNRLWTIELFSSWEVGVELSWCNLHFVFFYVKFSAWGGVKFSWWCWQVHLNGLDQLWLILAIMCKIFDLMGNFCPKLGCRKKYSKNSGNNVLDIQYDGKLLSETRLQKKIFKKFWQ